jgi:hypothetical protein
MFLVDRVFKRRSLGHISPSVKSINGKPSVEGVERGDRLGRAGEVEASGATMGRVVDALRGAPGDIRNVICSSSAQ